MGLLDDAIREHLELKRLRGADPGEVAREEQDALGPIHRQGSPDHGGHEDDGAEMSSGADGSVSSDAESSPAADSPAAGQETVEINMDAELAAGADAGHEPEATKGERAMPVRPPARTTQVGAEESLEWEMPSDSPHDPEDGPESESDAASYADHGHEDAKHVEDVLEETPDFLRDTPEQERLWFEQRPPRDFDFNE